MIQTAKKWQAKQLAKFLREENPDYNYLRELFRHLRQELSIEILHKDKKLPYVPRSSPFFAVNSHLSVLLH